MKRIVVSVAILLIMVFVLVVVRETYEVVALAGAVHPLLGQGVLWALLAIYAACVAVPVVAFVRLPKRLVPPPAGDEAGLQAYLTALAGRLRANRNLSNHDIAASDPATVDRALQELAHLARQRIVEAATTVFVSTAVSQSGRLDGLMVLGTQSRLVWHVAHLYWQRPSFRDLTALYANVATAAFVAQSVDDFDFSELVEPLLAPVLANSAVSVIPGFGPLATVIANSSIDGTVNAFLTLRVGCLTSAYCRSVTMPNSRSLRRTATAEAAGMLGAVARHGAERVASAIWDAAKRNKVGDAASVLANVAARTADHVSSAVSSIAEASGARTAAGFLGRIVTRAATRASSAISETAAGKQTKE
jgi:hypothetical protein